jgi:diguanylate cyclase (GGDEF)-like protein
VRRLWRNISTHGRDRLATPEERRLAGRSSAALWLCGALTLLVMLPPPGPRVELPGLVAAIAALALAWGVIQLRVVPWERIGGWVFHASTGLLVVAVAVLEPFTGDVDSPTHEYLWLVVVYAAFFYRAWPAAAYWLGCGVVSGLPLLYADRAVEHNLARELFILVLAYAIVGSIVFAGREVLGGLSRRATALGEEQARLAAEQSSLRRVAMTVAAGSPPQAIFALVSAEAGRLLGGGRRRDRALPRRAARARHRRVGGLRRAPHPAGPDLRARARRRARPAAVHRPAGADVRGERRSAEQDARDGLRLVRRRAGVRGHVGVGRPGRGRPPPERVPARRRGPAARVHRDDRHGGPQRRGPLAARPPGRRRRAHGAANHRAFRDRLTEEVSRARRHERPLTVAVVNVDRFGELTETIGPEPADQALVEIGGLLRSVVRDEDVVARLGADEFGIAFLETDRSTALLAAERARQLIAGTPLRHGVRLTVSLGLCDLDAAPLADELLRRADAALFWSKEHGRDRSWVYDPSVVRDLAAYARRRDLETEQGLSGLRALARAIDAKDQATREHSEPVATMAARLATERGWDPECVERLREAAALHDVGKIGVPDAVLLKPGRLDRTELALMREHAALGAQIVGDVLDEVQVRWIAAHHERPDGQGYPHGLSGPEIPEGAALLALADAWDSMVSARLYSPPREVQDAIDEIRALAGRQFTVEAVEALEALHERGALAMAAARMHRPTPEPATPRPA